MMEKKLSRILKKIVNKMHIRRERNNKYKMKENLGQNLFVILTQKILYVSQKLRPEIFIRIYIFFVHITK